MPAQFISQPVPLPMHRPDYEQDTIITVMKRVVIHIENKLKDTDEVNTAAELPPDKDSFLIEHPT